MDYREVAKKWAVFYRYKYDNLDLNSIVSKVVAEVPEIKKNIKEIIPEIKKIIDEVMKINKEEAYEIILKNYPQMLERKKEEKKEEDIGLKPPVNTRFAPAPTGYLHIGHSRAIILNHYYAKKYNGKFILRLEDTDPKVKKPLVEVYDKIKEDVEWLIDDKVDGFYIQSERLKIYYDHIVKLIEKGYAYIDLCSKEKISENRRLGKACEHREKDVEWNLEQFEKMLNGEYNEGEAVIRIKTDVKHPNPSIRDWIAFRIIDPEKNPHPWLLYKYGENEAKKYYLWPTYNFAVVIDDHLMGVNLVIRMKEHEVNTYKQRYIYKYFGWEEPKVINYGAFVVKDMPLHKSEIRKLLQEGKISGWDDPSLPTLRGLKKRGITREAIRRYVLEVGLSPVDITIDWERIYTYNREIIDRNAKRYFIIRNPIKVIVEGFEGKKVKIKNHPAVDLGEREYEISSNIFYIEKNDIKNKYLRLMEFINIEIVDVKEDYAIARYIGDKYEDAKKLGASIIQWVSDDIKTEIKIWEGYNKFSAIAERKIEEVLNGEIIHAIRYGFLKKENDYFIYVHK